MKCARCGNELGPDGVCAYCQAESRLPVRVLSARENSSYQGVTIEEDASGEETGYRTWSNDEFDVLDFDAMPGGGIHVQPMKLTWKTKLMLAAAVVSILAFTFFVALPLFGLIVGASLIIWLVRRFLPFR